MMQTGSNYFFDVEEFERLIEFFMGHHDHEKTWFAINAALQQYPENQTFLLKKAQHLISVDKPRQAIRLLNILKRQTLTMRKYS